MKAGIEYNQDLDKRYDCCKTGFRTLLMANSRSENPVLCWGHKGKHLSNSMPRFADSISTDLPKQKGLVTYQLSSNAVNPKKHFWTKGAIFNTARRSRNQFLYVVPPFLAAYIALKWAEDRYVSLWRDTSTQFLMSDPETDT